MVRYCALALAVVAACSFREGELGHGPMGSGETVDAPRAVGSADAAAGGTAGDAAAPTWHLIETMYIDTRTATPVVSQATLTSGVNYRVQVSGTFVCTYGGTLADAEYYDMVYHYDYSLGIDVGLAIDDTVVSGHKTPRWGAFEANHIYTAPYVGHGAPLKAVLFDSEYDNNMGKLQLDIQEQY